MQPIILYQRAPGLKACLPATSPSPEFFSSRTILWSFGAFRHIRDETSGWLD
jgi:hypothetical protein